ncbi:hypothetical protein F8O01_09875 [Pseudoclavibacter chungangensis]|uniref:DUF3806 domain-containing protein n=1 Tax=Pseudoclavibacter chungangensis TaxID=587635 RepID=A0A7J5BT89_9MICO|nr:hypothetical protein [Pseudoclavibacter chungangensis]KAB1656686.1 hypothetical protein F8O01_09875 [Pseudoclavibacter chungangensis]NYJ67859.1 hypothetical protein [Pseudoclavibacter chungangensis]
MPTIETLPADVRAEVADVCTDAAALLGVPLEAEPAVIVDAIEAHVSRDRDVSDDAVVALGALLGEQYVRGLDWRWAVLDYGDDTVFSVVDPSGRFANQPMRWMLDVARDPEREIAFRLNYEMVRTGDLAPPEGVELPLLFH